MTVDLIAARFEHPKLLCSPTKLHNNSYIKQTLNKTKRAMCVYVEKVSVCIIS